VSGEAQNLDLVLPALRSRRVSRRDGCKRTSHLEQTMFMHKSIALLAGVMFIVVLADPATPQAGVKPQPKPLPKADSKIQPRLEAIAETKLIMEGLAHANFRGLERIFNEKPADAQSWTFARGQALLLAETANLLMLRPPKNQGQAVWFERAMELRNQATQLAKVIATKDYNASKTGIVNLANTCNRCHQSFRISVEIAPFSATSGDK
jgi:Cytochrome C'